MSEYLAAAAEAMGLPETLVERSAEARAEETGASVDEILQAWAGGETVAAAPAASEEEPADETAQPVTEEADDTAEEPTAEPEQAATPAAAAVEVAEPAPARAPTRAPVPETVTPGEAARLPEVITVPTAGIKEKTNFAIPKWLTAVLVVVPLFALFALGGSATGECGEATELRVDVVTGNIVNCDGSEFTGQAVGGGGGTDFIALGADVYSGAATAAANCAGCHGVDGQGSAAFPALTGVMNTFGSCVDHIEWVRLGSTGWEAQFGNTYGDTNKTVAGGMPGHSALTEEQLAAVVAFERVRFGGAETESVLVDCGLVEDTGGEGEGGNGGGEGEDGGGGGEETGDGEAEASASRSG